MAGRLTALALALILLILPAAGEADLPWRVKTPAQERLRTYITQVNSFLEANSEWPINTLFEMYNSFAVFGITREDNAEIPEDVEITVYLFYETINKAELRVSDPERFPAIAGAFLQALYPDTMTREEAMKKPSAYAQKVMENPLDSFEQECDDLPGEQPRIFYAYYPNQHADLVDWMQMTILFPLTPTWEGTRVNTTEQATNAPNTYSGYDEDYEGYFADDDYSHYDYFTTPTPEPDSAAGDDWMHP